MQDNTKYRVHVTYTDGVEVFVHTDDQPKAFEFHTAFAGNPTVAEVTYAVLSEKVPGHYLARITETRDHTTLPL